MYSGATAGFVVGAGSPVIFAPTLRYLADFVKRSRWGNHGPRPSANYHAIRSPGRRHAERGHGTLCDGNDAQRPRLCEATLNLVKQRSISHSPIVHPLSTHWLSTRGRFRGTFAYFVTRSRNHRYA